MKARIVLAVLLLVAVVQLWREPGRAVAPVSRRAEISPARTTAIPNASGSPSVTFSRDPFRFDQERAVVHSRRAPSRAEEAPSPDPAPARVRLVGLVRRAGVVRAALVVDGEVVLASAGETASGFRVVSIDEEGGVRLRDPEGLEATLALPEEP